MSSWRPSLWLPCLLSLVSACAPAATAPAAAMPSPTAPATAPPPAAEAAAPMAMLDVDALVAAPDRSDADRALDAGRQPAETLRFFGVQPGMRVAEIAAGTGYTAELLARAVGPEGQVHAVNNAYVLQRFAEGPWSARLTTPPMAQVRRIDREFDAPFPPDLRDLDLVVIVLFYHDTVWMETDRTAMNAAVLRALRPGGHYVVIDHEAAAGHGVQDAKTLHRIEGAVVRSEIEAAGFELEAQSDFLRHPADTHDWNAAPGAAGERRGESDRFAFKFVKPAAD